MLNVQLLDLAAVPLALGYAIGRIGCQLSGDGDYGEPWDGPWAMAYPEGTVPTTEEVHPTPIYETLTMGARRLRPLALARPLPAGHPLRPLPRPRRARALPRRVRPPQRAVVLGLTQAQVLSLGMIVAGLTWMAVVHSRQGTISAAGPDSRPAEASALDFFFFL